jgi:CRISPR-associated endonuclease/helicase Cas3
LKEGARSFRQSAAPWAKLRRGADGRVAAWHSLVDHTADVAACFEAVLACARPAGALAALAGRATLPPVWVSRLAVLAAMHDFGKANAGFQARWDARAPFIGHCRQALAALRDRSLCGAVAEVLPLREIGEWGAGDDGLLVAIGHHGRPLDATASSFEDRATWRVSGGYDPIAALAPLGAAAREWYPDAFSSGGEPLPEQPAFWHAISGYLTFADWLGSDEMFFPFADGRAANRMEWARSRARNALESIGFASIRSRTAIGVPSFARLSPYPPRPMQSAAGALTGRLAILESETGSGKTEAALWRFARLFAQGAVEGLYFALPTRVAAISLHARVCAAVEGLFPDPAARPQVTLAVPGMAREEEAASGGLPHAAPDETESPGELASAQHWASERPKKFLAGTIAVGTIDQALLGVIRVKHAHLRAACLLRHFLVVDEVHASDAYMARLLEHLLSFHVQAGGHALLLSATLGAAQRTRFLQGWRANPPSFADAVGAPYPALWSEAVRGALAQPDNGRSRSVGMTLVDEISDPQAIAARAITAARAGAKVLVVRNLRRDAIAVFRAILEQNGAALLFSCRGAPTLHHGRFAREDRALLDAAIQAALGKERPNGGLIAIGTQTLEQSLDIDADLLITDLCPADVLLQRLGRLHRHERLRPVGFERPNAVVLAPDDLAALAERGRHGMGFFGPQGNKTAYPYPDLLALEATRRLIAEHPAWSIPAMNRLLVESVTHPEARAALLDKLEPRAVWAEAVAALEGRGYAYVAEARHAKLPFDLSFADPRVVFPNDERLGSRLGARDLLVVFDPPVAGPFGAPISQIALPDHWARGIDPTAEMTPTVLSTAEPRLLFSIQGSDFIYDCMGLQEF